MKLTKVERADFGSLTCDVYQNTRGEFYMTRQQIGEALEYKSPRIAIAKIHKRYSSRLDAFSVVTKLVTTDGKEYETILYNAKGVYEICRHSEQPKADAFYDWVYELLEGLRIGYLKVETMRQSSDWQTARQEGKKTRRLETDAIKQFVEYAYSQGSKNADWYYTSFSTLADNAVGIPPKSRDRATTEQILNLRVIEGIIDKAILQGMEQGLFYKDVFKAVKRRLEEFVSIAFLIPPQTVAALKA